MDCGRKTLEELQLKLLQQQSKVCSIQMEAHITHNVLCRVIEQGMLESTEYMQYLRNRLQEENTQYILEVSNLNALTAKVAALSVLFPSSV